MCILAYSSPGVAWSALNPQMLSLVGYESSSFSISLAQDSFRRAGVVDTTTIYKGSIQRDAKTSSSIISMAKGSSRHSAVADPVTQAKVQSSRDTAVYPLVSRWYPDDFDVWESLILNYHFANVQSSEMRVLKSVFSYLAGVR
jgi:hypothetical protein